MYNDLLAAPISNFVECFRNAKVMYPWETKYYNGV